MKKLFFTWHDPRLSGPDHQEEVVINLLQIRMVSPVIDSYDTTFRLFVIEFLDGREVRLALPKLNQEEMFHERFRGQDVKLRRAMQEIER